MERHLAVKALATLALDTLNFNGHTTASDTLWAGVPLLTLPGDRMQASTPC
jgi:predicted O-linked N-acetylglucosamine transferase (SPINDLY family)